MSTRSNLFLERRSMSDPEISIGSGKTQVILRGRDAIRAAGWALRLLLFARAASLLALPVGAAVIYGAVKWWLTQ
jgi:hypothetical protein